MTALRIAALLIYTCGAFAYVGLLGTSLASVRRRRPDAPATNLSDRLGLALWTVSLLWFIVNVLIVLAELGPWPGVVRIRLLNLWLAFAFPPLIVHLTWAEVIEKHDRRPGPWWSLPIWPAYVLAGAFAAASTLAFRGVGGLPLETVASWATAGLVGLFVGASVYSMALLTKFGGPSAPVRERQSARWHAAMFGLMALLFVVAFLLGSPDTAVPILRETLGIALRSLPLAFMFVGTYFERRFEFFDLFVKRGIALIATMALLAVWFALALPVLGNYDRGGIAPWVYAIVLLPIAMTIPWLHARIGALLDRTWLGRRFTTVAAVKYVLAGLRPATTPEHLVQRGETCLSDIFDAHAAIVLDGTGAVRPDNVVEEADIRSGGRVVGRVLMGPRRSDAPYFSEDKALLESLADVFGSVLDNVRLQARQQEQDRHAHELTLHASRSELKALRAQINPHFLFNALNAIAGLIHRDPDTADRTIEKLADVFRYTLRGSEGEWAVLEDELEFVRAYLDVEQARFGTRLRADVDCDESARGSRLPTMIVQTLVENAIKHGVAAVKGPAVVTVSARRHGDELLIAVADNGPGFEKPPAEHERPLRGGRFGLANIRQRLAGYYGRAAVLSIERETPRGITVVSVALPFRREESRMPTAVGREGRE